MGIIAAHCSESDEFKQCRTVPAPEKGKAADRCPPPFPCRSGAPLRDSRDRYLITVIRSAAGGASGASALEFAAR
jgi:hypothetical protein